MIDWLQKLEVGDAVMVEQRCHTALRYVERTTKTQIILKKSKTRYNRSTGRAIGSSTWDTHYLVEATDATIADLRERIRVGKIVNVLRSVEWKDLPIDKLEQIYGILE